MFSFLSEHDFFSFLPATAFITGFTFLALDGHAFIHLIQDIHFSLSTFLGFSLEIAPTGQDFIQIPHPLHALDPFGFKGIPLYSLYGLFPFGSVSYTHLTLPTNSRV